jgi:hypothetical protein
MQRHVADQQGLSHPIPICEPCLARFSTFKTLQLLFYLHQKCHYKLIVKIIKQVKVDKKQPIIGCFFILKIV